MKFDLPTLHNMQWIGGKTEIKHNNTDSTITPNGEEEGQWTHRHPTESRHFMKIGVAMDQAITLTEHCLAER